jgi:subtilisin family serine protease
MPRVPEAVQLEVAARGHAEVVALWHREVDRDETRPFTAATLPRTTPDLRPAFLPAAPRGATGRAYRSFPRLGLSIGFVDESGLDLLASDPRVATLAPAEAPSLIRPVRRAATPATGPAVAWGVADLGAPALWKEGVRGAGVRIAHLDTGVDGEHPALRGRIAAWAEFDAEGEPVAESTPHDPDGHGTHTAGTLVGGVAGGGSRGTAIGVAPEAELCAAIVIEGGRVLLRILAGMEWALGEGARVLSLSLGIRGYTPFALELLARLRAAGMLPVVAIGNEGAGTSRSPGNYPDALSVGAMDARGQVADFSSSMRFERAHEPTAPDVVAPGVAIVSASAGGGREEMDGTSMATPHVAGLAALLISARPESTVAEIESAIFAGVRALPDGADPIRYGRGAVDGLAALTALRPLPA